MIPRTRQCAELSMKKVPRKKPFSKVLLNSMAEVLNRIPDEMKVEKPHLFKKKLKKKRFLKPRNPDK